MMNEKIFVVSGNMEQFNGYRKRRCDELSKLGQTISYSNFTYVHGPEVFRGHNKVHGVFTGSYMDRADLRDIVREIKRINGLHPSETVVPGVYVGRGLQSNPIPNIPNNPKPHVPLSTWTTPMHSRVAMAYVNGAVIPPGDYVTRENMSTMEAEFHFREAPPMGAYIQVQYGKDLHLFQGNGTTNVFKMAIPYTLT